MENVTSMVYIKNSTIVGFSGEYTDFSVFKDYIFIHVDGLYLVAKYGTVVDNVVFRITANNGKMYFLLVKLQEKTYFAQGDKIEILYESKQKDLYVSTISITRLF
jgi:hypothetical protein